MTGRTVVKGCLAALLVAATNQAWSLKGAIGLSAFADYTNNTLRVSSPKVGEWIYRPGVDFTASHDGPTVQVDAGYRYERRIYEKELNEDRNVTTGSANIDWQALPNRLDFYLRNTRNESTINSQAADRPNNRQVTSTTEAGPLLRFQTRGADELQFEYQYRDVSADRTASDSEGHTGTVRYILKASDQKSLSLDLQYSEVDFDNPLSSDIEKNTAFLTFVNSYSQSSLSVMAGYTHIERIAREDVDGPVFSVDYNRSFSTGTVLSVSGDVLYSTESRALTQGVRSFSEEGFDENLIEDSELNELFRDIGGRMQLAQPIGATNIAIYVSYLDREYDDVPEDNTRISYGFTASRQISPTITADLSLDQSNREYSQQDRDIDEFRGSMFVNWIGSPNMTVTLGARYQKRGEEVLQPGFSEWLGTIGLRYVIAGGR